ncbi:MAG: terminase family protein [candidate division WOR-3 bacterium]
MVSVIDKLKLIQDLKLPVNEIQKSFLKSTARFKIFRAARRVGKSYVAALDVLPEILMPNTRGWIIGPTYSLAEKEFRYINDFLRLMHRKLNLPRPAKIRDNPKAGELYIEMPWGSEVHGKSADNPLSLVGEENDWIILSEAAQHTVDTWFRLARPTLSSRLGRAIFPTTPDITGAWLEELETRILSGNLQGEDWEIFTCAAWDTMHFDKKEIESARKELSEEAFMEQYGGEWRFQSGRVFKGFNPSIHLVDEFKIPPGWTIRVGIDYGNRDETAVLFMAQSSTGEFYFIDEYYKSDRPTDVHINCIKMIEQKYGRIAVRVADHHALGKQLMLDWSRKGLPSVSTSNDRKTRRDRFMGALELRLSHPYHIREAGLPQGQYPRVFIFKNKCPNLIRELTLLRWRDGNRKEGSYGDTIGDDHAIDAATGVLWYATQHIPQRAPRILKPLDPTGYYIS